MFMIVYFIMNQEGKFLVKESSTYNSSPCYSDDWTKAKMYKNMSTAKSMVTRNSTVSDKLKVASYQLVKIDCYLDSTTNKTILGPFTSQTAWNRTIVCNQGNKSKSNFYKNVRPLTKTLV